MKRPFRSIRSITSTAFAAVLAIALTACATITTGQHYLIDLVASVPFAAMIVKLVNWRPATSHGRAPQAA